MAETQSLTCRTCGKPFTPPPGRSPEVLAQILEKESARCGRLREVSQQRDALALARRQPGFPASLGGDTIDRVMQRESFARLESALKDEAEGLVKSMWHAPQAP